MAEAVIRHQVSLILRLIDTTTGNAVPETRVQMLKAGKPLQCFAKGDGIYVLINVAKEDFFLQVNVYGYEERRMWVQYEELDSRMPMSEVFLMPKERHTGGEDILALRGNLPGIESIEAVKVGEHDCYMKSFDEEKLTMNLFNPHRRKMKNVHYAFVNAEKKTYEHFKVLKEISECMVMIDHIPKKTYGVSFPIARVIFGMTGEDGSYALYVRDDAKEAVYLVKYQVKGKEKFQLIDFHHMEMLKK